MGSRRGIENQPGNPALPAKICGGFALVFFTFTLVVLYKVIINP